MKKETLLKQNIAYDIGEAIRLNPKMFMKALNSSGIKTTKNPTEIELVNAFVKNSGNKLLQKNVAEILLLKNDVFSTYGAGQSYLNSAGSGGSDDAVSRLAGASGGSGGKTPSTTIGADPVSAIAGAIGSIFSFASSRTERNTAAESERNALTMQILNGASGGQRPPLDSPSVPKWVWFALGGVAIAGVITIIVIAKKNKAKKMELGGVIDNPDFKSQSVTIPPPPSVG